MQGVKGFFDLNVSEKCVTDKEYEKTIRKLYNYGYRTIAINQTVDESNMESKKKKKKGVPRDNAEILPVPLELKPVEGCEDMTLLNRLTICFNNQDIIHKINKSPFYRKYDLIAILPGTQQAFQFTCSNIDADILCFDPEVKNQFKCNRRMYNLLKEKGYHFEIAYSPAIRDSTLRKNTIHTAHLYHTFGKSRNIVITSGAESLMHIRGPYDIVNLGLILGLSEEQSKNSITHCSRNVYISAVGRRVGKSVMIVENTKGDSDVKSTETTIEDEDDEMDDVSGPAQKKIKSFK